MKKFFPVALGVGAASATAAYLGLKKLEKMDMNERCDMCSKKFVNAISKLQEGLPDPPTDKNTDFNNTKISERVYLKENLKNAKWSLGYSQKSIVPEDIDTKKYCIAGNTRLPANFANGVLDDIRVRTVVLDDNSGRGAIVLSSVDCIGISNKNVSEIRRRMAEFSEKNNISHINISSTHTHSSIDTMGIWGEIIKVIFNNRKVLKKGEGELLDSCDNEYMEFLFDIICQSIKEACLNKTQGKLFESYMGKASQEGITDESSLCERGLYGYVWDRREPNDCSTQLLRIRFVPDDKNQKETILLNFGAHPYINSLKYKGVGNGDLISGDFIYNLGEFIEKNNYNFIFFNGPVAAVYPNRLYSDRIDLKSQAKAVGEEIGRVSLAMTMDKDSIEKSPVFNPSAYESMSGLFRENEHSLYSKWIELKGDQVIEEKEVAPRLNLTVKKVSIDVDNPIFYCIAKHRIGNFTILPGENGKYTSLTEIGLLELGESRKIAFIPGELEPAILSGSYATQKEYSYSKKDFSSVALKNAAQDEELTVFGLTNDAIGYIIPDNDFSMMFLGTGKYLKKLFGSHYLEIFSFGKNTAVSLAEEFKKICEEIRSEKTNER